jgi:hypothetical protein
MQSQQTDILVLQYPKMKTLIGNYVVVVVVSLLLEKIKKCMLTLMNN